MRCSALIETRSLGIRRAQDRTRQCRRSAKEGIYCRQHASMTRIYCGGVFTFLLKKGKRCARCGERFAGIYST